MGHSDCISKLPDAVSRMLYTALPLTWQSALQAQAHNSTPHDCEVGGKKVVIFPVLWVSKACEGVNG